MGCVEDQPILLAGLYKEALGGEMQMGNETLKPGREDRDEFVAFLLVHRGDDFSQVVLNGRVIAVTPVLCALCCGGVTYKPGRVDVVEDPFQIPQESWW